MPGRISKPSKTTITSTAPTTVVNPSALPQYTFTATPPVRNLPGFTVTPQGPVANVTPVAPPVSGVLPGFTTQPSQPVKNVTPVAPPAVTKLVTPVAPPLTVVNKSEDKSDDYYMQHRPAMRDDAEGTSAPLHDLTKVYPKDVYEKPDWYNMRGELNDSEAFSIARRIKDKPHAIVTIYRAVPKSLKNAKINKGDWVTINKDYAIQHGKSNIQGPYKILQMNVNAAEIFTSGDSINEWGYDPLPESEKQKLKDIRLQTYKEKLATKNKQGT